MPELPLSESNQCGCAPIEKFDVDRRQFLVGAAAVTATLSSGSVLAASQQSSYADVILAEPSLRGYWRFEDQLADAKKKAPANAAGDISYVEGVVEGKALSLKPKQTVSIAKTDHLRGRSATVELFFNVAKKPSGDADPVLIAQTNGQQVRYLVAVKNDLSALIYQNVNGDILTTINLPTDQPIEVGRWYHLAITSFDLDLRAYVDGFECSLFGGAFEFTRRGPKKSTMTLGATTAKGWGSTDVLIDEVACFAKGLTQTEIQSQLAAAGWQNKLTETGKIVAEVAAKRDAARADKVKSVMNDPGLTAAGETRVYQDAHLEAISFIVGGIGAGGIQFNGKAEPAVWQIACNFSQVRIPDSFLAIRSQSAGGKPVVRALQTAAAGKFEAMSSLKFEGEYPFAKYRFDEPALPVEVELEVFNPLIPLDLKNSAIPCAIYNVTVTNPSSSNVKVDLLAAQQNALGFNEGKKGKLGKNKNQILTEGDATLLHMTRDGVAESDMVLMTQAAGASGSADCKSNGDLHKAFSNKGACEGPEESKISAAGKTVNGALSAPIELAPNETKTVTFALTWYFKNGKHGSGKKPVKLEGESGTTIGWTHIGQNYTNWWSSARDVAAMLQKSIGDLTTRTRRFHDTLYASSIPVWVLDRISSQLAVLRSQTCWWAADGYFGAWEGSNPVAGCCAGNCTHVWHYAQGHARLLPELGRKMREQDYDTLLASGLLPHRATNKSPAADGHFGTILNTYREHLCSADDTWLKSVWPKVKKAMDWGIEHWDPNRDGYMEHIQHNTLDGAFTGCSSWIGTLYLTALEASARMAELVGEAELASDYRTIRASGKTLQNEELWNGEYYIQKVGAKREQDYLDGCHIDQILGEWWGGQLDIDANYPADRSKKALQALLKHNFLANFIGQSLKPRQYCEIEDGGMKMITWPNNPQPIPGMKYGDEVMTGFEYGAAVTMIQKGMLKEGLMVMKLISDRYDGRLRTKGVTRTKNGPWGYSGNPFGDDECGKFYGRSLSVWSALLALQGFQYDGPAAKIGFAPVLTPENHSSLFTASEGYGLFSQTIEGKQMKASIKLSEGQLRVGQIILEVPAGKTAASAIVRLGGNQVGWKFESQGNKAILQIGSPMILREDDQIDIEIEVS